MQLCEAIISLSKLVLWKVLPTWFGSSLLQHFRYSNFKTAGPSARHNNIVIVLVVLIFSNKYIAIFHYNNTIYCNTPL